MSRSWMLAAPAALALLVAGCTANQPTNQISPVANASGGVGNAPGNPVSPNSPPAVTGSLTNTEAQAAPAPGTRRSVARRSGTTNAAGFGGTNRAPAASRQEGNGGS